MPTITFDDLEQARARIAPHIVRTPLLESPLLNRRLGGRLLVKAEPLQRTGSFKLRGAMNAMLSQDLDITETGVLAYSSGNHAQGVAAAANILGVKATIVMPKDAPQIKVQSTRAWGARVVLYDRASESREAIGEALARDTGAALIKPFDDPKIIAGQGSLGLEIAEDCLAREISPDAITVPCSGGGLTAGVALALKKHYPALEVYAVEPEGFDDTARSLAGGTVERNERLTGSICDALMAPSPGVIPLEILRSLGVRGAVVSDQAALNAMRQAFEAFKLVVEPGGAVGLAAILSGATPLEGRTVIAVLSGGNVAPEMFQRALQG